MKATVIDLFAGPGGLGEGFSSFSPRRRYNPFSIAMSVEKEGSAHKTLELRAFYRQFRGKVPDEYYEYVKGIGGVTREKLFAKFPNEYAAAVEETLGGARSLGNEVDDRLIYSKLRALRKKDGPWVVIGGPPCQAYSLVGRARNKGVQNYIAEEDQRHFLYEEYLRVLWCIKPEVFVMENVKGILSSKVNGQRVFPTILDDLSHPGKALGKRGGKGYRIYPLVQVAAQDSFVGASADYVIRTEKYGIPQARHRVILLGIRSDIEVCPDRLRTNDKSRTTQSVLADLPPLRSGLSKSSDSPEAWHAAVKRAIKKVDRANNGLNIDDVALLAVANKAAKLKSRGGRFVPGKRQFRGASELAKWYLDDRLSGFLNHESRGHIADDLARYMFCATFAKKNGVSPRARDFPKALAPNHANWGSGNFVDRFKVQVANKPSSTVTSHISKDGHYYIHPDPCQCRSLTVREAARLQTFPDNYFFEGNRTQQYVQVGNAVPPLLARQIAEIVFNILSSR